jgi:hypothetical protein
VALLPLFRSRLRYGRCGKSSAGREIVNFPSLPVFLNRHSSNSSLGCQAGTNVVNLLPGLDTGFLGNLIIVQKTEVNLREKISGLALLA